MGIYATLQREKRADVFDPIHPKDPALARLFRAGLDTLTNVRVDHDSALSSTALFAAVRFISENMASVPLPIARREGRGKEPLREDRRWGLLNREPNPEQTAMEFREMMVGFVVTTGNAYAEIVEGEDGVAEALWPIPSWRVRPVRTDRGALLYAVRPTKDSQEVRIPPERMLHFRGFSRNGVLGEDVIDRMREAIGITLASEKAAAAFYGHGAQPSGVLQTEEALSDRAWGRLKKERDRIHGGVRNWHRLALLEEGVKWQQVSTDPEKSQLIQTRKFQVTEVARITNLPPHVLKDLERSTFSNIEQQGLELVTYSFRPWAVRMEQVYEKRLLLTRERTTHLIRHNLEGFLRGDLQSRYEAYSTGRQWGWLSANDVRDKEDMNGIGDQGDVYMAPINMLPADQFTSLAPDQVDDGDGDGGARAVLRPAPQQTRSLTEERNARNALLRKRIEAAWRPTFAQRIDDLIRREANAVRNAIERAEGGGGVQDFLVWMDQFYDDNAEFLADNTRPMFMGLAAQIYPLALEEIGEADSERDIEEWVEEYAETYGVQESSASQDQLRAIVREQPLFEDAREAVETRVGEWEGTRAEKSAMRESVDLGSAVALLAYRHGGVRRKRWQVTGAENCPLCRQMQGRIVGIEAPFVDKGDEVTPQDEETSPLRVQRFVGHPQLHGGCDCTVVAEI